MNQSFNNKFAEKNKEIKELENKLNYYKNKLFSSISEKEKDILNLKMNKIENTYSNSNSKNDLLTTNSNININQTENTNNNIISTSTLNKNISNTFENNINSKNNIKNNINYNTNEKGNPYELLSNKMKQNEEHHKLKNNSINNNNDMGISQNILKESKISQVSHNIGEETINFSLSEDESGLSSYFKFRTSQLEDKDKDKDKEYNYNDVLPIINKVSKLKEIKETEEDQKEENNDYNNSRKNSASDIVNNVLNAISDSKIIGDDNYEEEENNEDEKYKNILNKFKQEDKNNDILYNHMNNIDLNNSKDIINSKPKMIRKNSFDKEKRQNMNKMITFEEFLTKENVEE